VKLTKNTAQQSGTDFSLTPSFRINQLSSAEVEQLLPDNPDTRLIESECIRCHGLTNPARAGNMLASTWQAFLPRMKVHDDTADHPVYNLVVAKGGPKLMDYHAGDSLQVVGGPSRQGKTLGWFGPFNLVGLDVTMADLAGLLNRPDLIDRAVINKTGLTGTYDFTLPIPAGRLPDQLQQAAEDAGAGSVFEGVKQLGLQLVPSTGPIRGMVVDHIGRPPEN